MNVRRFGSLAVLLGVPAGAAVVATIAAPARAQNNQVLMSAARAGAGGGSVAGGIRGQIPENTGKSEVRLLWTVSQGWLPAAGVNVYRSDNPTHALNATPIVPVSTTLTPNALTRLYRPLTVANRPLLGAGIVNRDTEGLSKKAFAGFKKQVQELQTKPGVHANQVATLAAQDPDVQNYRNVLEPAAAKAPGVKAATAPPPTEDDKTVNTRIQVLIASLSSYDAAQKCGLAFVDTTAAPGTAYTYTLKSADAAATTLATAQVTASAASRPPTPEVDATQMGQGSIMLHWEPISEIEEKSLVHATYNVFRGEVKLNPSPIRIAFTPTKAKTGKAAGHIATMASYVDNAAPQSGVASYTVTMTDAFGRVSAPAHVSATMVDQRVPGPVPVVYAFASRTHPGAVRVFWVASDPAAGDLPPVFSPGPSLQQWVTVTITPLSYSVFRTPVGDGQPDVNLTQNNPIPSNPNPQIVGQESGAVTPVTTGIQPELLDVSFAQFLQMFPQVALELTATYAGHPTPALTKEDFAALQNQTLDKVYAKLTRNDDRVFLTQCTTFPYTYLDTPPTADKDYVYHVGSSYVMNPTHRGTMATSATVAVPIATAPPTPGGLAGGFTTGSGSFGYLDTSGGALPKMRLTATAGAVEYEGSHVNPKAVAKLAALAAKSGAAALGANAPVAGTGVGAPKGKNAAQGGKFASLPPGSLPFTRINAKYFLPDAEKAPPIPIAGHVPLQWQPSPFTSAVTYKVYRASATGIFATFRASGGTIPNAPANSPAGRRSGSGVTGAGSSSAPVNGAALAGRSSSNLGHPLGGTPHEVAQARSASKVTVQYYEDFSGVPDENYVLLATTAKTQYMDTLPVSQRVHYHYRIVPVSRWGVEGPPTAIDDVMVPATLPPSVPTLLKAVVDENVNDGHVRLVIVPNPKDESVDKYYIFSKEVLPILNRFKTTTTLPGQSRNVQVASRRGAFAAVPPRATAPGGGINPNSLPRLNPKNLRANGGTLMKAFLSPFDYVKVGEVSGAGPYTFDDLNGLPNTQYVYEIVAVNKDGIGSRGSSPLDATALKVFSVPPGNLTASLTTDTSGINPQVALTWTPPAQRAEHYVLERALARLSGASASDQTYVTIAADILGSAKTVTDTTVRSGRHYFYRLRAVDSDGVFSRPATADKVVPALAAAAFNDPTPPKFQPTTTATTPIKQPDHPTVTTTTPTTPTSRPINNGGTPVGAGGKPVIGSISTPLPESKTATFANAYFLTGSDVFAVQVKKAAYSVQGYAIDAQNFYYCRPTEKFLRLTLLVKNVTNAPQTFDYQTVTAGGQSADGDELAQTKNWKAIDTGTLANRTVGRGEVLEIEGVVTVPAAGDPKTLTFDDLAFDLTDAANRIDPLPAALGGGTDAPAEAPAKTDGTFYSLALTDGAVTTTTLPAGLGVNLTVRNVTQTTLHVANENYKVELYDEDGDKYTANTSTVAPVSLAPGATTTLHFAFDVPKTIKLKTLKVRERDGRIYAFPVGTN